MKKIKLLSILALSTVVLGACSALSKQSSEASSDNKENTEQVEKKDEAAEVKEKVTKDAEILLDSVLTSASARFKKIYGETYEKWTDAIIAVQTSEKIKEDGLTPASDYSVQWVKEFQIETPEETISNFLKVRRNLFQKLVNYNIKDVVIDDSGNTATVAFTSKKLHSLGLASSVRTVLTELIGGIDNLGKYNQAGSSETVKRYQNLLSYWIFHHLYKHDFAIYSNVDANLSHVPFTKGEFDTEIKLTKDKDGNWVISQDDYKTLLSELIDRTEGYDTIDRSGIPNKKATNSSETSTDKTKI